MAALDASEAASDAAGGPRLRRERLDVGAAFVAPSGELQTWLAGVWSELLNLDRIGAEDDFFELGGNSIAATELFGRIEERTGARLLVSTIIDHPTVAKLAVLLAGDPEFPAGRSLVSMRSEGAEPPLYFFHVLTGEILVYRHLLRRLAPGRKVCGLQYPGHDRVPFPTLSIPEMAAIYVDAIREAQPRGPYFFAGFSLGGTIAYETAHQISAKGGEVGLLALIDSVPPRGAKLRGLRRVARKLARHLSLMSDIVPAAWPAYLFGVLRRSLRRERKESPVPAPARRPRSLAAYLYGRYDAYDPPPYHGPIKVLRCSRSGSEWNAANLGWAPFAKGLTEIAELPGDHVSIMGEPIVALVAAHLDKWLAEAEATSAARTSARGIG
jgi:thioesterase domain-containing protein/acyl carrier protein